MFCTKDTVEAILINEPHVKNNLEIGKKKEKTNNNNKYHIQISKTYQ